MPGRPDFTTAGSGGSGQTLATMERPEIESVNLDQTGTVASGQNETVELYAPSGAIYRVVGLRLFAPSTGGANTHKFAVKTVGNIVLLNGQSNGAADVSFRSGQWVTADASKEPAGAAQSVVRSLRATENSPARFQYFNNSGTDQTGDRTVRVAVEEVSY